MEVEVRRGNRKSVTLRINKDGKVIVNCPYKFSKKDINKILEEKKNWIESTISKVKDYKQKNSEFYNLTSITYLGENYLVDVHDNCILLNKGEDCIYIKKRKNSSTEKVVKDWLIKQANAVVLDRLASISAIIGIKYKSSEVISARKKWGSCDNFKNIKLNYRLVMMPKFCIDYVCVHELCHIKHMNHSKEFWSLVSSYVPNYKDIKKFMATKSYVLEIL